MPFGERSLAPPSLLRSVLRCLSVLPNAQGSFGSTGPADDPHGRTSLPGVKPSSPGRGSSKSPMLFAVDVPVQFFQSAIAIALAVAGALLWQMRFFDSNDARRQDRVSLPDARLRLGLALVLGTTLFGSLWAIADEGPKWAAYFVTIGLAVSILPIGLRVLPPLAKDSLTNERDPDYAITVIALVLYVVVVAGFLILLDIE